jgi:hypothetical protein
MSENDYRDGIVKLRKKAVIGTEKGPKHGKQKGKTDEDTIALR